ncbi:MAG: hypothetical protein KGR16_04260 [Verrucomicrobia bacterium]|nr:hypothetical protein [Verrucomicrobiota bacterium]
MTASMTVSLVGHPEWTQSPRSAEHDYLSIIPYYSWKSTSEKIRKNVLVHENVFVRSLWQLEKTTQIQLEGPPEKFTSENLETIAVIIQTYAGAVGAALRAESLVEQKQLQSECAENVARASDLVDKTRIATGIVLKIHRPVRQ